jgi:hypothetical protein
MAGTEAKFACSADGDRIVAGGIQHETAPLGYRPAALEACSRVGSKYISTAHVYGIKTLSLPLDQQIMPVSRSLEET